VPLHSFIIIRELEVEISWAEHRHAERGAA
jgi:hypothetical protein